jgi:hypothetical protein
MFASINRYGLVLAATLVGVFALMASAMSASAAGLGLTEACKISGTTATCDFPVLSTEYNTEIHYFTAQCSSTGATPYNIEQLTIIAIPPNLTTDASYASTGNRESVNGVVNTGAIVDIFVKVSKAPEIVISFSNSPGGTTRCSASVTYTD